MADIGQEAERIEKVIERARDLADRYGRPSDVQPGPIAGHVTLRWTDNSCSMVAVEFDTGLPAAEAVEKLREGLRKHDFGTPTQDARGSWLHRCRVCGFPIYVVRPFADADTHPDRYGCPGKKEVL